MKWAWFTTFLNKNGQLVQNEGGDNMLQIRNRYNYKGELIDIDSYQSQHTSLLEDFLTEMYASEKEGINSESHDLESA